MRSNFTDPAVWTGGFYALCLELPAHDDATAAYGLAALWGSPQLSGCFARNDIEPTQQVALTTENLPVGGHLYGVATLGDGQNCVCGSYTTHFEDEGRWLAFYLPISALATIYPVGGYPFGSATPELEHTLKTVNAWFRTLAAGVYEHMAFTFGVIGFETDFSAVKAQAMQAIPEDRWDGLIIPIGDHLLWYPPTRYGTQYT